MEVWKDVNVFDGKYSVSNLGNVRSNGFYVIPNSDTVKPFWKVPKIIKPYKGNHGYLTISFGRKHKKLLHRIVLETFIDNPNNYKDVNHINGIKTDNRLENLEWCNRSQNNLHAYQTGLKKMDIDHKGTLTCLNTETGIFYDNAREAHRYSNLKINEGHFRRMLNNLHPNKTSFILV